MISLPSSYLGPILIAAFVAALLFHLSRMLGRQRWVHAAYAAAAVGLIYLLGVGAFGWAFDGQDALFWLYAALFVVTGVIAARRRATLGAIGLPWLSALIQLGVVAYMFAPEPFRKPPVTAALFLYFLFEAVVWLRGREESVGDASRRRRSETAAALPAAAASRRRRSFPRCRGYFDRLSALRRAPRGQCGSRLCDGAAAGPADRRAAATAETAASEEAPAAPAAPDQAESSGSAAGEQTEAAPQVATREPSPAPASTVAKDPGVYTARAGDTFKSIARRLYGTADKWRALAAANPDLKAKKFRAGQLIKLPSATTR